MAVSIQDIKFTSIDSVNACLASFELKLNRMRFTPYNGFNFEDSFVNTAKRSQIEADIAYLKSIRPKMRCTKIAKVCETDTDKLSS